MTHKKMAAPDENAATKTHNLPADFTIDAPKSADAVPPDMALHSLRSSFGWRGGYVLPDWSSRNLSRLQRKHQRLGRKSRDLLIAGFDGGEK